MHEARSPHQLARRVVGIVEPDLLDAVSMAVVLDKLGKMSPVAVNEFGQLGGDRLAKLNPGGSDIDKPRPGHIAAVDQIEMRIGLIETGRISVAPLGKSAPGTGECICIVHVKYCRTQPAGAADRKIAHMKKLVIIAIAALGGAALYKLLNSEYTPPPER